MRVLFTAWAWPSHVYAMVPLAWAFRAAGHDVRVATPPGVADVTLSAGLTPVRVGRDVDAVETVRGFMLGPSAMHGARRSDGGGTGGQEPSRALGMFTMLADAMADDLVAFSREWRPDLVVHEPTAWAGALVAADLGVPVVRHAYGPDLTALSGASAAEALGPVAERLGLEAVDPLAPPALDPCPGPLRKGLPGERWPIRYVPYNGSYSGSSGPPGGRRPRVCVTWGTTIAKLGREHVMAGRVAKALADHDVEVVVAVPTRRHLEAVEPLPENARILESPPLDLLFSTCDLVVHHGGAGSILTGLTHGLPQVAFPQIPDHLGHASRLADSGAGLMLDPEKGFEASAVRAAVDLLLSSPGHREAADRMRVEMEQAPTPARAVVSLEKEFF